MNTQTKKQLNSIDLFKFLMSICVIAIHTRPYINCSNSTIVSIIETFISLAVPFFFLSSGYLLFLRLDDNYYSDNSIEKIRDYTKHILYLLIAWSIIYLPLDIWYVYYYNVPVLKYLLRYTVNSFFNGGHYNSHMLWYLLSTVYASIIILWLFKHKFSLVFNVIVGFIVITFGYILDYLIYHIGSLPQPINTFAILVHESLDGGRLFQGLFYLTVGMLLANKRLPFIPGILFFFIGFVLCTRGISTSPLLRTILNGYSLMLCSIGFFSIVEYISLPNSPIFYYLRKSSTIIYFIHLYIWSFYYKLVYNEKTYGLDCFIFTSVVSIFISVVYLWIQNHKRLKSCINS